MKVNSTSSSSENSQTREISKNFDSPKTENKSFFRDNNSISAQRSETAAVEKNLVDRNAIVRTGLNRSFAATTETRFDYNTIQGVSGNPHVTPEFISGVEAMAGRIGARPEHILAVMSFETGGTFDPAKTNSIGATGLIQFLPSTARGLGTTTADLRQMSSVEQLSYVEKYFSQAQYQGKLGTLEGLYTSVLSGTARQNSGDVLFTSGTRAYEQNPLDWNRDGRITAGEAVTPVAARLYGGTRAVQQRLVDLGFVPQDRQNNFADGAWGPNTSAAVRGFQTANNLPATGLMDDRTGRTMFGIAQTPEPTTPPINPTPPTTPTGILKKDSRGAAVETLQDNLVRLGFMTATQKATGPGIFGQQTENSLKAFQRSANLEDDGIFGPNTANAMRDIRSSLGRTTTTQNETVTKGIQDRLVELGFMNRAQVNTGYGTFGPQTEAAVKRFQARSGIQETGRVGETTFRALFASGAQNGGSTVGGFSTATNGRHYTVSPGILMTDSLRPQLQDLADRYFQRTGGNLHITSGYRPPDRQASAMYDLIVNNGTGYVRNLYANKGAVDQILSAYRGNSSSRSAAVAAMTRTISDQTARGVYISDHLRSEAIDISTSANFGVLSEVVREMGGTTLNEGNHYHVEF